MCSLSFVQYGSKYILFFNSFSFTLFHLTIFTSECYFFEANCAPKHVSLAWRPCITKKEEEKPSLSKEKAEITVRKPDPEKGMPKLLIASHVTQCKSQGGKKNKACFMLCNLVCQSRLVWLQMEVQQDTPRQLFFLWQANDFTSC